MDALSLLRDLIALPSVNPMGRDLSGPEYHETRMTDYLAAFFAGLGVPYEKIEVFDGRCNVIAEYRGADGAPVILFDAHQDTVPVDGMVIPPFEPAVKEGRVYGRGACDVKGGMAAMLAAFARLLKEKPAGAATVVMSCTCDEESGAKGIEHLVKSWSVSRKPDFAVIAEPTELDVVVAHRGAFRWKVRTAGRACHSSRPEDGVNAIYRMAHVLCAIEEYAAGLAGRIPPHPLCGPATLSVGIVAGGSSVNTVPDECLIEIDRRCIPGEDLSRVIPDVEDFLRQRVDVPFEFLPPWIRAMTLSDETNGPLADRLLAVIADVAGPRKKVGVPYGTHASRTAQPGVPSVVFGPGSIAQAHTEDEWIAVDQLEQAAEVYYRLISRPQL
jgi:acetylornithine deacetylase/succinyl-diaminopimelate desuccinylase family protein